MIEPTPFFSPFPLPSPVWRFDKQTHVNISFVIFIFTLCMCVLLYSFLFLYIVCLWIVNLVVAEFMCHARILLVPFPEKKVHREKVRQGIMLRSYVATFCPLLWYGSQFCHTNKDE